jgi:hypothetical protein
LEFNDHLRENVIGALEELGEGFLRDLRDRPAEREAWRREQAPVTDGADFLTSEEVLTEIFHESVSLLYRLFFLFYAESRNLLPMDEGPYRARSLQWIRDDIISALNNPDTCGLSKVRHGLWGRLRELFALVPSDGGDLFDPQRHPFLERFRVNDHHLARALDLLSRTRPRRGQGRRKVAYSDLEVRHLGSIYEGVLDYSPQLAAGQETEGRYHLRRVGRGSKRKSSGSYYTPEPIVQYVIEQALGPLVRGENRAGHWRNVPLTADEILGLKVVDPAMGSGHFLLAATEYLARAHAAAPGRGLRGASEEQLTHSRRLVAERCIYGVDVNPMAVELAKLSLRLLTVGRARPLCFLDHHLRAGNAIVGAWVEDLAEPPAAGPDGLPRKRRSDPVRANLFGQRLKEFVPGLVRDVLRLVESETRSEEAVRTKKRLDRAIEDRRRPLVNIADAWVGAFFGEEPCDYHALLADPEAARGRRSPAAEARHAFHWELAFPEVFFDAAGERLTSPGFDAVVGNPPYVSFGLGRVGTLGADDRNFHLNLHPDGAEYKISSYALFMDVAARLVRPAGLWSYVLPDSFLVGRHFSKIRARLLKPGCPRDIVLLTRSIWESGEAGLPVILTASDVPPSSSAPTVTVARVERAEDLRRRELRYLLPVGHFRGFRRARFHLVFGDADLVFVEAMLAAGKSVRDYVDLHQGLIARAGRATFIGGDPRGPTWRRGLVESDEVRPFRIEYRGRYVNTDPAVLKSGGYGPAGYEVPKVLLRRTGDTLIAAFDRENYYATNALVFSEARPGVGEDELLFLMALLNSRLGNAYYHVMSMKKGRAFPQVEIDFVLDLPVPDLAAVGCRRVATLARDLGTASRRAFPALAAKLEDELARAYTLPGPVRKHLEKQAEV